MLFSSLTFLLYFFPIFTLLYYVIPRKFKNTTLLIGSLFFYAWGEPVYILLMVFSIIINYLIGLKIGSAKNKKQAKVYLILAILICLGLLFYFKYFNFTLDLFNQIFNLNIRYSLVTLPIGISFYSFQILSYIIDVYRGKVKAQKNLINFGVYVSLFPQLIAGPIVRYKTIEDELANRTITFEKISNGLYRFVIGLSKKVLLANTLGSIWTTYFNSNLNELSLGSAWLAIICFSLQIFFDFSGYSDMAIGLGKMYGFNFLENFDKPYISKSISEFWRRWHISLSSWFKEYVYIPLGGNRKGARRQIINIFIVWSLTGLWHGASVNFILWGMYYAILLIIEKLFLNKYLEKCPNIINHIYSIFFILIGWLIFECTDLNKLLPYISAMFNFSNLIDANFLYVLKDNIVIIIASLIVCNNYHQYLTIKLSNNENAYFTFKIIISTILIGLCLVYLIDSTYNPFIYFRF